jgi:hypothetical protein
MVDKSRESHLSFDSIARLWFEEDGAPGETRDEILQVLVSAMWRGEFERDGNLTLAIPFNDDGLGNFREETGDHYDDGHPITRYTTEPNLSGYEENVSGKWSRLDIYDGINGINRKARIPPPLPSDEQYEAMATTPLSKFESYKVEALFEELWIARDDFGAWVQRYWALPKFWFPTKKMDAQVSESKRRRGRPDNKRDIAERRNKYEMIFAAVRKKWTNPTKRPSAGTMANFILANNLHQGMGRSAVRQLILGTYQPALRLGIKL